MTKLLQEPLIANFYMDINNNNDLHTHQGMDSRHIQKGICSDKIIVLREHYTQYKHCYQ